MGSWELYSLSNNLNVTQADIFKEEVIYLSFIHVMFSHVRLLHTLVLCYSYSYSPVIVLPCGVNLRVCRRLRTCCCVIMQAVSVLQCAVSD